MRGKGFGTPLSVRPIDEQLDVIHSLYNRRKSTENIHRNRETLSPRPSNALSQFNKNNLIGREFSTIEVKKQEIPESSRNRKECASMQMQRSKSRGMHNLDMGYPTRKKYSVAKEMNRDIARYANKVHRKTQRGEKVVTAYLTNIHDNNTIRKFIKRDNVQDLFGMFKFKTLPSVYKDHHGHGTQFNKEIASQDKFFNFKKDFIGQYAEAMARHAATIRKQGFQRAIYYEGLYLLS